MQIGGYTLPEYDIVMDFVKGVVFFQPYKQIQIWQDGKVYAYCSCLLAKEVQENWIKWALENWEEWIKTHEPLTPPTENYRGAHAVPGVYE